MRSAPKRRRCATLAHQCGSNELTDKEKNWYRIRFLVTIVTDETCIAKLYGGRSSSMPGEIARFNRIRRDPPRLVFREQLGSRSPARLILEIDIRKRLAAVVAHDKARL